MAAEVNYVFDSSAVIALIWEEPGACQLRQRVAGAVISSINLGEAATVLLRRSGSPIEVRQTLQTLPLVVAPWTEELAWQGLDLSPLAWTHGLSLGDRACLTLARALGRTALTADRAWVNAAKGVQPPLAVEIFR